MCMMTMCTIMVNSKRQNLSLFIFSLFALLSCSKVGVSYPVPDGLAAGDNQISFNINNPWTKYSASSSEFESGDKVGIFSYYHPEGTESPKSDFIFNEDLNYNGISWTYAPVKYWPNGTSAKLSFYAYWPYKDLDEAGAAAAGSGKISLAIDGRSDLMWGIPVDGSGNPFEGNLLDNSVSSSVSLKMSHLLCKLGFKFRWKDGADSRAYHVSEITISNVYRSAELNFIDGTLGTFGNSGAFDTTEDLTGGSGNWQYPVYQYDDAQESGLIYFIAPQESLKISFRIADDKGENILDYAISEVALAAPESGKSYMITVTFSAEEVTLDIKNDGTPDGWQTGNAGQEEIIGQPIS